MRAAVGGLKGVISKLGDAPPFDHKWKSFPQCPFCGKKDKAGVYTKDGAEFFKCHNPDCSTGGRVVAETGYINLKLGLSEQKPEWGPAPAYEHLLKMAGLWQEPSRKTSNSTDQNPPQIKTPPAPPAEEHEDEELIQNCLDVIRAEQRASVSLLQRRLKLGYARAARIMDELERRGLVGPAKGAEPREIRVDARFNPVAFRKGTPGGGTGPTGGRPNPVMPPEVAEEISFENLPPSGGVPVPASAPSDGGAAPAPEINVGETNAGSAVPGSAELPTSGPLAAQAVHNNPADGLQTAQSVAALSTVAGGDGGVTLSDGTIKEVAQNVVALFQGAGEKAECGNRAEPRPGNSGNEEKGKPGDGTPAAALAPGMAALRWFYDKLTPTSSEMRPVLPGGAPLPEALTAGVVRKLEWVPVSLLEKRGLTPETCALLGFRANPRSNEEILQAMTGEFDWHDLAASGLWLPSDRKRRLDRRPNPQFCGKGLVGRKEDNERRNPDDKWHWGWSQPVLIPYFDELGRLVKLRPHKGGAAADTAAGSGRVYIPRQVLESGTGESVHCEEKFFTVVVCEGEYKAAALWQEAGAGAFLNYGDKREAVGSCALPGISFVRNKHYRADLLDWLIGAGCQRVIVSFDEEDNSHKPLARRFDAKIYMRYLAQYLKEERHLRGLYAPLPVEWRNTKGKADWDGALVKLLAETKHNKNEKGM